MKVLSITSTASSRKNPPSMSWSTTLSNVGFIRALYLRCRRVPVSPLPGLFPNMLHFGVSPGELVLQFPRRGHTYDVSGVQNIRRDLRLDHDFRRRLRILPGSERYDRCYQRYTHDH